MIPFTSRFHRNIPSSCILLPKLRGSGIAIGSWVGGNFSFELEAIGSSAWSHIIWRAWGPLSSLVESLSCPWSGLSVIVGAWWSGKRGCGYFDCLGVRARLSVWFDRALRDNAVDPGFSLFPWSHQRQVVRLQG